MAPFIHASHRTAYKSILTICVFEILLLSILAFMIHNSLRDNALGIDFYTFWIADRSLLIDHISPYSDKVTQASQIGIYGALAQPNQDQVAFVYPIYSLLLIAPIGWLSYEWAYSFWLSFNILALLTILLLIFPKQKKGLLVITLFFYPITFGLILGNFSVLLGTILLTVLYYLVIKGDRKLIIQIAAGVLLAWTSIKPQFVLLYLCFCILFALRERLWPFLKAFFCSLGFYFLLSEILMPAWVMQWIIFISRYTRYVESQLALQGIFSIVLPKQIADWVTWICFGIFLILSLGFLALWWRGRIQVLPLIAWIGIGSYLFRPHGEISYEQIIFLIPLILWVATEGDIYPITSRIFWFATLIYSWVVFFLGKSIPFIDRSPALLNLVFVIWLLSISNRKTDWRQLIDIILKPFLLSKRTV